MDHLIQYVDESVAGTSHSSDGDVLHTEANGEVENKDDLMNVGSIEQSVSKQFKISHMKVYDHEPEELRIEIYRTIHTRTEDDNFEELWQKKNKLFELKACNLSADMQFHAPYFPKDCPYPEVLSFHADHVQCHETKDTTNRFEAFSVLDPESEEKIKRVFSYGNKYFPVIQIKESNIRSELIKNIVNKMLEFIKERDIMMYNSRSRIGFWQSIMVQINSRGEGMMILGVHDHPENLLEEQDFKKLRDDLCKVFRPVLHSLVLVFLKRQDGLPVQQIVFGNDYLYENIGKFIAKIYGRSRVWVNPSGVDIMMKKVLEIIDVNRKEWGVIMIGSFIGVDCLYIAENCGQLVMTKTTKSVEQLIVHLAQDNGISNISFMSGHHVQQVISGMDALKEKYDNICAIMWCCDLDCQYASYLRDNEKVKKILLGKEIKNLATIKNFVTLTHDNKNWSKEFVLTKSTTFDLTKFDYVTKTVYLFVRLPLLRYHVLVNESYSYATVEKILHTSQTEEQLAVIKKKEKHRIGCKPRNKKKKPKKTLGGFGPWVPVVYEEQVPHVENQTLSKCGSKAEYTDDSGSFLANRHCHHRDYSDERLYRVKSFDHRESSARKYERERRSHEYRGEKTPHHYSRNSSRQATKDRYKSSKKQERNLKNFDYRDKCKRSSSSDSVEEARYDQRDYRSSQACENYRKYHGREHSRSSKRQSKHCISYSSDSNDTDSRSRGGHRHSKATSSDCVEAEYTDDSDSGSINGNRHSHHRDYPDERLCRVKSFDHRESSARKYEHERRSHEYRGEKTPHHYSRNSSRRATKDRYKSSKEKERNLKNFDYRGKRKRSPSSDSAEEARYDQRDYRSSQACENYRKSHGREHSRSSKRQSKHCISYSSDSSDTDSRSRGGHSHSSLHSGNKKDIRHSKQSSQYKRK